MRDHSTRRYPLPGNLSCCCPGIGSPGESEGKIRQAIEVDNHDLRDLHLPLQADHSTLSAPAYGAGDMKCRGFLRSAGQDERLQCFQLAIARIDRMLELRDPIVTDARFGEVLLHLFLIRSSEQSADAEQITLNRNEHFVYLRHRPGGTSEPDECVELIHIAVRLDARMILRNAAATEESGHAFVAGLRVNLHVLKCGYIWRDARDKGHDDHRRRTDGSFRLLLCGHAGRDGADSRHTSTARRAADSPVSGEVHLRRRRLPPDPG